ncbi:MAG: hypothetical protein QOF90_1424 [Acetobacteraceae bacterium]|nr:hypothetical protein [Acetobacteraceae bacterium]
MRRNAFWSGFDAIVAAILSLVTSFAVARIIGPAELGIGAAATMLHVVLWVVTNALFADAIVQRAAINDRVLSTAFWASIAVGCLAMLVQAVAGPGLAAMMGDDRLVTMSLVLAAPLPLVGAAGMIQGLLTRERAYRRLALRTVLGQGLGTSVGVWAACAGAGAWALVWQQAVGSGIGALAILLGRRWKPRPCFDFAAVRSLLAIGLPLTASTLVLIVRYRLFAMLIGASAGAQVLGQVHIAFRLVETVRELTFSALWRLLLPALSEHQHDRQAMLKQVDRWLRLCAIVVFPLCTVLAIALSQIVTVLLGLDWLVASQATLPLIALMAWSALTFPSGVALIAVGKARFALYANMAGLVGACAVVLVQRPTSPWQAVMIWTVSQILVSPYSIWVNARALGVSMIRPLTGGFGTQPRAMTPARPPIFTSCISRR